MKKIFLVITLIFLSLPVFAYNTEPIRDELLEPNIFVDKNQNTVLKLGIYKKGEYKNVPIKDELIDDEYVANASKFVIAEKKHADDFFFEKNVDASKVRKILPKTN